MKDKITSFRDLEVYKKLFKLSSEAYSITLTFPDFEKYELGSQLRRSANSAPANLAEGWNNKHINIYLEGINRSLGEIQETEHHLAVALNRKYIKKEEHKRLHNGYQECGRMLRGLSKSLMSCKKK